MDRKIFLWHLSHFRPILIIIRFYLHFIHARIRRYREEEEIIIKAYSQFFINLHILIAVV